MFNGVMDSGADWLRKGNFSFPINTPLSRTQPSRYKALVNKRGSTKP